MYSHLVLGGTFDHFHSGHEKLLRTALSISQKVLLGLTMPQMNEKKAWSQTILPYEERKREIVAFVKKYKRLSDFKIIPISDVYGTTLTNKTLDAILVTPHSQVGADLINEGRKKKGLPSLEVEVCDLVTDDSGEVLSSTRIREGKVNRSGFVYSSLFHHDVTVSEEVKAYVRQPLGEIHYSFPDTWGEGPLLFVGDIVTETAVKLKLPVSSAWIDGRSHREPYNFSVSPPYRMIDTNLTNPPGTISSKLAEFMDAHLAEGNTIFKLEGEEDLLTLPAILLSPLGSQVVYGNPFGQKGITVVSVTEEKKQEILSLLL